MSSPPASALNSSPHRCRIEPTPEEPKVNLPGFVRIKATRLLTSDAGIDGFTASIVGVTPTRPTGAKSRIGSYGMRLYKAGLIAFVDTVAISKVYLSGAD